MRPQQTDLSIASTPAGDDGEAVALGERITVFPHEELGWYVAVVRCNCENRIAEAMIADFTREQRYLHCWVVMDKHMVLRRKRRVMQDRVLIHTFIFVQVEDRHLNKVAWRSDVYKLLTMPGQSKPYRIPEEEFNNYKRLVTASDAEVILHSEPLRRGDKVIIHGGPLQGCAATVQEIQGSMAVVGNEIHFISGATIKIPLSRLEFVR